MTQVAPRVVRFSTDDYPENKRIEAYREIYGRTIARLDVEPIGDEPFHFNTTLCGLPDLGLGSSLISPCRRSRGPQHLDSDDLLLGVSLGGGCIAHQLGREATMSGGEAVLMSGAEPGVITIPSVARHVSIRIPHSVLGLRIADVEACVARQIPQSPESRLLTGYVGALWTTGALMNSKLRDVAVAHVHDLVCLMLGARGEVREVAEQGGARAARRSAILHVIESRSGDPGLSATAIAALLAITPRYVHLLLEETGRSFTHHVLEKRLERAAALLRDPQWCSRKVADIAAAAGFTDLSYFNRAFRRHYGATPSDIRRSARGLS